ncbi:septin-interacting protein 1 [Bicyclus anynana]|uniref:Septin-interacting protein 1 n=1 Tax=Bicyclus anynana TaxID=110368 RepID=A0A6J1NXD2_BICAN|nr:septin-interacting protein 1 [Bicyclus anynana]XP_052744353.1 septin-interacting protein 1 [Bicyclus anynana]XP_052744354.1 septin-interacting protein 1 [Bicyclus anynana]XP_052744355.1 septin-interacting protein 1 [Bicyclus anynana]XP_052744357.1 septin-interacting protein 1 [Bicyclus anynana]
MSDDEVIRFEITDYDLENEFNPNRSRKAKREQQIYGVWAQDSDEEDNEDNVRRRARKPKDFSAPIGFVAGGVQQAGKKKENKREVEKSETSRSKFADSSDEEAPAPDASETAGVRRAGRGAALGGGVGTWERHTKGIGAKLLLQMGYQPGKGLGKDLQGISAPVEASVRRGRGAVGAYGPEKAAQKAKEQERRAKLQQEQEEKGAKEKSSNWRRSHKGRYFYKDAADVIQEGAAGAPPDSACSAPVIDMTGRARRVLSGYHALRAAAPRFEHEPRRACSRFAAPALAHNLALAVACCERDIVRNARELRQAEDDVAALERELRDCDARLRADDEVLARAAGVLARVQALRRPDLSLDALHAELLALRRDRPLEFAAYGLSAAGGALAGPLLGALLAAWDPLAAPALVEPAVRRWRDALDAPAYDALLWAQLVPRLAAAAAEWNPREPERMLAAVEAWRAAAPAWLLRAFVARHVAPRVLAGVRAWDPTRDPQPLHAWVLPWHALAGEALARDAYPLIRARLAAALAAWHPADRSARPLLAAWREAWGPALAPLLERHVLPKLEQCVAAAPVELLHAERNAAWACCAEWTELLGAPAVGALAARALLPRWLAALAAWLNGSPPHAAVLASYTAFRALFPEEVLREPAVRDAFRKALDMLNRSSELPAAAPAPAPAAPAPAAAAAAAAAAASGSFTELLEARCAARGLALLPLGRAREGRPLWALGALQVYVLRNVAMCSTDGGRTFEPLALDRLLALAGD